MAKPKKTDTPTPTNTAPGDVLSLETLTAMAAPQRVDLYVATESRQRLGFLLQGKILFTLGSEGLELLRAAGIKPSSLHNARKAEWVLRTFTGDDALKGFFLHDGTAAAAFTEASYDGLTLLQCELLQKAFTRMGQVLNRPDPTTSRQICAEAAWDDNLECWFENGCTVAELEAQAQEAEAEVAAERVRQQQMSAQIAEQEALIAQQRAQLETAGVTGAAPPPPPVVTFNAPAATVDEETEEDSGSTEETTATPTNVVAFTAIEEEDGVETPDEPDTVVLDPPTETTDAPTPEEIGSAVADATEGMSEFIENGPVSIDSALSELEDYVGNLIGQCDVGELHGFANRLTTLLELVNGHIVAKAAAQDELPKAKAKRSKKLAAAA